MTFQARFLAATAVMTFLSVGTTSAQTAASPANGVEWQSFENGLATAERSEKKLLVDVYAPWCGWCSRLQADVYTDDRVQEMLKSHFAVARVNIDRVDDEISFKDYLLTSAELAVGLGATGTPTTVFLESNGDYITRLPGYVEPNVFLQILDFIRSDAYKNQSFEQFAAKK